MRKITILVGFLFFSGCTTVNIVYPVIKPMEGLKLVEKGVQIRSCMLEHRQIPKVYAVEKKDFSLYIIGSHLEFPKLYLGAKDKDGNVLTIGLDEIDNNYTFYPITNFHVSNLEIDRRDVKRIRDSYGITNMFSLTKTLPISKEELTSPLDKVKLYLYDKNKKKVGEVQLEFELKSTSCKKFQII